MLRSRDQRGLEDHFFGLGLGLDLTVFDLGLGLGLMRYWSAGLIRVGLVVSKRSFAFLVN